jgi:hypothetical protein
MHGVNSPETPLIDFVFHEDATQSLAEGQLLPFSEREACVGRDMRELFHG